MPIRLRSSMKFSRIFCNKKLWNKTWNSEFFGSYLRIKITIFFEMTFKNRIVCPNLLLTEHHRTDLLWRRLVSLWRMKCRKSKHEWKKSWERKLFRHFWNLLSNYFEKKYLKLRIVSSEIVKAFIGNLPSVAFSIIKARVGFRDEHALSAAMTQ